MAFDKPTRNRLSAFVSEARHLIAEEFTQQFQSLYGISDKGTITPLDQLGHLDDIGLATAALLRERIDYFIKTHAEDREGAKAAVARLAREQAFTVLNRLAAIRMAEKRGLIVESVGKGYQSKGFKVFEQIAGSGLGDTYHRYRRYIFCLFDELAVDLGVLFDRRSPQGLLFPREAALLSLLTILNASDLDLLWAEDETIGWIYQYYNDPAERKKMRDESAAPRNSRELAVRNQFFTPRYVVEFLTDNTLGRIWYEMTKGKTRLTDQCRYLVRRPAEIFLKPNETEPRTLPQEDLSQEELLKQPVYISHRSLKDPREIGLLDPACGSMHFGLYAFDLFETIYEEAWDFGLEALRRDYPEKDVFLREVPRLIIEQNIHGIDIDPRAVQIAGLSLWLRAQKSWQSQHVPAAERPRIIRSNVVCAEPMPGSAEMLREFTTTLHPPLLGQMVEKVFAQMQLAGEAGSLLKIEEEIATLVGDAKKLWKTGPKAEQLELSLGLEVRQKQEELPLDISGISDERFWDTAEERIYTALHAYSEQAEVGSYQRRLFAEDAAKGFAFIDLCRKRYDVVVMNPPFGESAIDAQPYIDHSFPESKTDIFGGFVTRCLLLLAQNGRLGAITNRAGFFNSQFEQWRNLALIGKGKLDAAADLGYGVLDAMVETVAYIVTPGKGSSRTTITSLLKAEDKGKDLLSSIESLHGGRVTNLIYLVDLDVFRLLTGHPICYWVPEQTLRKLAAHPKFETNKRTAKQGLATADDFRFIFAAWEVPSSSLGRHYFYFAKGGEYRPFWDDIHLVINWENGGEEAKAFAGTLYNSSHWSRILKNVDFYFKPGLTYPERTTSDFAPRIFPGGCIFSATGQAIFFESLIETEAFLGVYISRAYRLLFELFIGSGDAVVSGSAARHYKSGIINTAPVPELCSDVQTVISEHVRQCTTLVIQYHQSDETTRYFTTPTIENQDKRASLRDIAVRHRKNINLSALSILNQTWKIDKAVSTEYKLVGEDLEVLRSEYGIHPCEYPRNGSEPTEEECLNVWNLADDSLVDLVADRRGYTRQITKKSFYADRKIELICHYYNLHPDSVIRLLNQWSVISKIDVLSEAIDHISYALGCMFGRWDIRVAINSMIAPRLPNHFDPLPACPPGMLVGQDGLPAEPDHIVSEEWLCARPDTNTLPPEGLVKNQTIPDWEYPLRISWSGILVDDENHVEDIVVRIREAIEVIWKDRAEAIEHEACELLGVKALRDYFRRPAGFFADHLKRYSKSRRQAPIYWPLSTAKGSYTLWIYYHRLTDQTLHTALADFIDPKLKAIHAEIDALRESGNHRTRLEELLDLEKELADFHAEIEGIIKLPWKPNLNDGVLITASPLWKLFRLPKWQKDLKACWEKLEKGEYDWAHLAYSIWPKRVEEACKKDRSIAIAHDLEHLCQVTPSKPKGKGSKKKSTAEDGEV